MADKTAHQRKADLKYCPVTLKEYLAGYKGTFSRDIDELWNTHDLDKNNYLDKEEARPFIAALALNLFNALVFHWWHSPETGILAHCWSLVNARDCAVCTIP